MSKLSDYIFYMAVNIYHEARGEPQEGKIAVGHVVINRAIAKHKSTTDVILQPYQFSWHNNNALPPIKDYEAFKECMDAVEILFVERLSGETLSGADHYFNPHKVLPSWAKNMKLIKSIGNHDFYKE